MLSRKNPGLRLKLTSTLAWSALIMLVQVAIFYLVALLFNHWGDNASDQSGASAGAGDVNALGKLIGPLLENAMFLGLCGFASMLICCPLIYGIVKSKCGPGVRDYLALRSTNLQTAIAWIAATLALGPVYGWLLIAFDMPNSSEFIVELEASRNDEFWATIFYYLGIGVAVPVFEEFLFRGFIFRAALSSVLGKTGSVVLTAVLFTALHVQYDLTGLTYIFCLGLLLGAARVQTGSLYVPLAMHVVNNLWALIAVDLLY